MTHWDQTGERADTLGSNVTSMIRQGNVVWRCWLLTLPNLLFVTSLTLVQTSPLVVVSVSQKENVIAGDVVRLSRPLAVRTALAAALSYTLSAIWRMVLVEWLVSSSSSLLLLKELKHFMFLVVTLTDLFMKFWCGGQKANSPLSVKALTRGPATATTKATNVLVSSA